MADINVTQEIIDVNVTEEVITIAAGNGAYPLAYPVYTVFGRTGAVVATEGDYSLTQLSDVTLTSPASGQTLTYNGTTWVNSTAASADNLIKQVRNNSGATITAGTVVYINGALGNQPTIAKALATSDATSAQTYGAAQVDIPNNTNGYIVVIGDIFNLNTSSYTEGQQLYLSGVTAGGYTTTKPQAPIHLVYVGIVLKSHPTQGIIGVKIQNGYELDELHDVQITSVANNNILKYDSTTSLWKNVAGSTTNISEGTNLYFTDTRARAAITLTTTGTSGAATYTSGVLNIPQYQSVLTNPVTGTGTTNYLSKWTASGTIGNGNVFDNGNGVIIGGTTGIAQAGTTYLSIQNNTLANSRGIAFYCNDGTQNPRTWIRHNTDSGNQYLAFDSTWSTSNGYANFAFLNGDVLINTTTDSGYKLDVNGTSRFVGNSIFDASIGIGTTSLTNYGIRISKNITGATSGYGVSVEGNIQSDVTTARFYNSAATTQATTFTLGSLQHYVAGTTTIGAGSTVTNQYGFLVLATAIGATNNYAFSGQLAAATNTWNLYNSGTANNHMQGSLGIGTTSLTGLSLVVSKNITGAVTSYGIYSNGTIQSDVTTTAYMYRSFPSTAASAFTLPDLIHYNASQGTIGSGSTVNTQYGFNVSSSLIGATTNYGFFGNIPSGTGRWNLFMNGTADNYLAGSLGIGSVQVNGGPILTTTLTDGGTGYADGTYTDVALIGGGGQGGLATFVVSGGIVTTATLTWGGANYIVGGLLSASNANLGGTGSGLSITVATVDSSQFSIGSTTGADITLFRNDTTLSVNDNIGTIKWMSNDTTTKASGLAAEIGAFGESTNGGAYLSFLTRSGTAGTSLVEAMRIGGSGGVGIGTVGATLTGYALRVSRAITGSISSFGIRYDGDIKSNVTTSANLFYTQPTTEAATFTLTSINHFAATQGTFGAGSTITNQYGFIVANSLTGATNNYGFFGNIPSGIGRYNLFMNGTAENYLAGNLGLGVNASPSAGPITSITLTNGGSGYVDGTYTNVFFSASGQSLYAQATFVVSGGIVTSATLLNGGSNYTVGTGLTTANTNLGGTGSGLLVTVATVDSSIFRIQSTSSSDISLFKYNINSTANDSLGSIKWEGNDSSGGASGIQAKIGAYSVGGFAGGYLSFFTKSTASFTSIVEAMRIGSEGGVGIGAVTLTGYSLRISKLITGATTAYAIRQDGSVQSDVTVAATNFASFTNTAAAAFTLGSYTHFSAQQGTIGAGSSITTQYGFLVTSNLTGATNNYGFYGNIPAQANAWNLYMNGTASNYMAGNLGIGTTTLTGIKFNIGGSLTGATIAYGINNSGTIASDVTSSYTANISSASTAASAFTLGNLYHYRAYQGTIGAGSAVTNQYGFYADAVMTGATNNYGFVGAIASGTNRWNLYMSGTAQNYLAGNTGIGVAATTTAELSLGAGTTAKAQINLASSTAPTSPQDGDIWFDGTNLKIRVGGVTKTVTIV